MPRPQLERSRRRQRLVTAAVLVAANRAIEVPILGDRPSIFAVVALWAAMGAAAAGLANFLARGES